MRVRIAILFLFFGVKCLWGQDSISVERDSIQNKKIYKNIQKYSQKKGFKKIYDLIFNQIVDEEQKKPSEVTKKIEKELNREFEKYQGRPIRKVKIRVLSPFGYDERDSLKSPNKYEKIGNMFHQNTRDWVVGRRLLFGEKDRFDSLKIKESERVLRNLSGVRRAYIEGVETAGDSIDVRVSVLEGWTLFADADGSLQRGVFRVRESNMFGLGHKMTVKYIQRASFKERVGYGLMYEVDNITKKNISAYGSYGRDDSGYENTGVWIFRYYDSKYARWAGGLSFGSNEYNVGIRGEDTIYRRDFRSKLTDGWGSFRFGFSANYDSRFTFSGRYKRLKYMQKVEDELNKDKYYSSYERIILSLGHSNVSFEQDRYVFRHRDIEYVPVGSNVSVIGGFERGEYEDKYYIGFKATRAKYLKERYFGADFEVGGYYYGYKIREIVIGGAGTYFSKLFRVGRWYFRQFIKVKGIFGINRKDTYMDMVDLNGGEGIIDFNSPTLVGTRKGVITLQTQSYSPFSFVGFRVSPFLNIQFGGIGKGNDFFRDSYYSKFSVGFYITNDYMVFRDIRFSFFYIPNVPGRGHNIYNFSGSDNTDFRLPYFYYQMPDFIEYR